MVSIRGLEHSERITLDIRHANVEHPTHDFRRGEISDADIRDLAHELAPILLAQQLRNKMSLHDISDGPVKGVDHARSTKTSAGNNSFSANGNFVPNYDDVTTRKQFDELRSMLESLLGRLLERLFKMLEGDKEDDGYGDAEGNDEGTSQSPPMQAPYVHSPHRADNPAPTKLSGVSGVDGAGSPSGVKQPSPASPSNPPVQGTAGNTYWEKDPQLTAKIDELKKTNPAEAAKLEKYVANTPTMKWISNPDQANNARGYFDRAAAAGKPVDTMIYISPFRDQNNLNSINGNAYSANSGIKGWNDWHDKIKKIASDFKASGATGTLRLETDQLSLTQRMPPEQAAEVCRNMSQAVDEIKSIAPNARVMLDGGFGDPSKMADTLKNAGIAHADGFTTGVASFNTPEQSMAFADQVANTLQSRYGINTKYDIDTSRSGVKIDKNGSDADWSDNPQAGLGIRPRSVNDPAHSHLSNFIWGKTVWQSDGRQEKAGSMIPMDRLIKYMENGLASGALEQ